MRVLLVDDHAEVRTMLRVALTRRSGVHVVGEAASLPDALDLAGKLQPEAVVLDLALPGAGVRRSHAALSALRQATPTSEVVVYTAHESDRDWYEREGVPFFGKATDRLADLVEFLHAGRR